MHDLYLNLKKRHISRLWSAQYRRKVLFLCSSESHWSSVIQLSQISVSSKSLLGLCCCVSQDPRSLCGLSMGKKPRPHLTDTLTLITIYSTSIQCLQRWHSFPDDKRNWNHFIKQKVKKHGKTTHTLKQRTKHSIHRALFILGNFPGNIYIFNVKWDSQFLFIWFFML